MCFEIIVIYYVILMDAWVPIQASRWISWLINEIHEDVSSCVFVFVVLATIVDTVVMIIPDPNNFRTKRLHLFVSRIFFFCLTILLSYMIHRFTMFTSQKLTSYGPFYWISVSDITSPHEQIGIPNFIKYIILFIF